MHRLFDEDQYGELYTSAGRDLANELHDVMEPIIIRYVAAGYSHIDIEATIDRVAVLSILKASLTKRKYDVGTGQSN